jgi:hypothetical protein
MAQIVLAPIDTPEREGQKLYLPVAANTHLYPGTLIALSGDQFATYAQDVAGLKVIGRCEFDVDNSADNSGGALSVTVKKGCFQFQNSTRSAGAYALTADNIGQLVYVENEQTVQLAAGSTNKIVAGLFIGFDPDTGLPYIDTRRASVSDQFTPSQNSITDDSTGTAAAPVAGVRTIAAVTSYATAANAIADLAAELNLVKADIAAIKALL